MSLRDTVFKEVTDELLDAIPPGATRVYVLDVTGKKRWRKPDKVLDTDKIGLRNGEPAVMYKEPGRKVISHPTLSTEKLPEAYKRKKGVKPTPPSKAVSLANKRRWFYSSDPLLKTALELGTDDDILALAIREFAVESSTLAFERVQAEKSGDSKNVSQLSIRRLKALQGLVDTYVKRQDAMEGKMIDLNGPAFFKLFQFIIETFQQVMASANVNEDQIETVITELSKRLEDETWINEAISSMRENSGG